MSAGRWIITDGARWFFDAGADSLDFTSGPDTEVRHWLAERFERLPIAEIGERELVDALGLREAITRLAAARADGVAPAPDDVDTLNLFAATPDVPPVLAGGRRQAGAGSIHVGQALSSLARDAVSMLGADAAADGRLRRCDAPDCRIQRPAIDRLGQNLADARRGHSRLRGRIVKRRHHDDRRRTGLTKPCQHAETVQFGNAYVQQHYVRF